MNRTTCDDCGKEYGVGDSPYCRDAHTSVVSISAGREEYYDEHVAPPPSKDFIPPKGIDYHPDKGYRITNPGDLKSLKRRAGTDHRDTPPSRMRERLERLRG